MPPDSLEKAEDTAGLKADERRELESALYLSEQKKAAKDELERLQRNDLEGVARDLENMHLRQHQTKSGPEGVVTPRAGKVRGGEREGTSGATRQLCQYSGISCGGCSKQFALGEAMVSCGSGLVHPTAACIEKMEQKEAAVIAGSLSAPVLAGGLFYGVYMRSEPVVFTLNGRRHERRVPAGRRH